MDRTFRRLIDLETTTENLQFTTFSVKISVFQCVAFIRIFLFLYYYVLLIYYN